ncbi:MAG: hypothetical protein ACLFS3_02845 [Candidatus Aenigmatarchaeota archaeon]
MLEIQIDEWKNEGYQFEDVEGDFDDIDWGVDYFKNRKMRGDVDILGQDQEKNIIGCCEVKGGDFCASSVNEAYNQLWKDKNHFSSLYPKMEVRTCMKLGNEPLVEVAARNESDIKDELIKKLKKREDYGTICKNLKYYEIENGKRLPGKQKGVIPLFAQDSKEKKLGLYGIVVGARPDVCQSMIGRLEKAREYISQIEDYQDYEVGTYIQGNGTSIIEVEMKEINTGLNEKNGFRAKYEAIDRIIEETPEIHRDLSSPTQGRSGRSDFSRSTYESLPSPHFS